MSNCYHCLSPVPENAIVEGTIKGKTEIFCCRGCLGVARWINESGLSQYYGVRDSAPKADNIHLEQYQSFDLPEIYQKYTYQNTDGLHQIDLTVEGIHCAACMWLIEKSLQQLSGVTKAEGNATTFTVHIEWDNEQNKISELLVAIAQLGYQPFLNRDKGQQERYEKTRRTALKRLALAGLGMMQVMMYSVALYTGAWKGMSPTMMAFLQWVSFFLATPVFFYAGFPFIQSAIQAVKAKHLNMDVPVALAITLAYSFSVYHLLIEQGDIYFDSVVMFVFFLSASRYLEMMGRYKALLRTAKNTAILPDVVGKTNIESLSADADYIPIDSLKVGDMFIVKAGEMVAADGTVLQGQSTVDESLLTGESRAIAKSPEPLNSHVLAGSINQEQTLLIRADAVGLQTTLAETKRLLTSAQTQKPQVQQLTDRLASYIVAFILLSTTISFIVWKWVLGADNAFEIALSVLVATCPCALSLAVPTAYAAASNILSNQRLFIKNNGIMDRLPKLNFLLFDKTGTLTTEQMQVVKTDLLITDSLSDEKEVLAIAAALEQHIHHPIAKAFAPFRRGELSVSEQQITSGKGVSGKVGGQYYHLGNKEFIESICDTTLSVEGVYLCQAEKDSATPIARFVLSDEINPYAKAMLANTSLENIQTAIASGDNDERVKAVADSLGIDTYRAKQLPTDKLNWVKSLQQDGKCVMMVGDGINDAPVLAVADISLAVGGASALSQSQADVILLNNDLRKIPQLIQIAERTHRVIWQNILWAIGYNLLAVPFAILGYLPPWLAALGMSISSLVVLGNALRIYLVKLNSD